MTVVEVEEDQGMTELSSVNANANIDVLDDYEDHDDNEDNEDQDDDEGEDDDAPELIDCVSPTNLTTRQPNFQIHSYSSRSGGSSRTRRRATPPLPAPSSHRGPGSRANANCTSWTRLWPIPPQKSAASTPSTPRRTASARSRSWPWPRPRLPGCAPRTRRCAR